MTRQIVVEMDLSAASALLIAADAVKDHAEYGAAAKRGSRAIQTAMREATRADDAAREAEHQREAAEAARLTAIAGDQPFENPKIVQPHGHPGSRPTKLACEVRVFSNARIDVFGHQCNNAATWLRPDYDEWGDIVLCPLHHNAVKPGQRSALSGFMRPVIDGQTISVPESIRHTKREWLALRDAAKT